MDASKSAMSHEEECPSLTPAEGNPVTVAATSIKLPPLWSADPHIWFAQVEAQFATCKISVQKTMYKYVVNSLTPEFACYSSASSAPPPAAGFHHFTWSPKRLLAIDNHMVLPTKSSYLTGTQSHTYRTSPFPCMVLVKSITELH